MNKKAEYRLSLVYYREDTYSPDVKVLEGKRLRLLANAKQLLKMRSDLKKARKEIKDLRRALNQNQNTKPPMPKNVHVG